MVSRLRGERVVNFRRRKMDAFGGRRLAGATRSVRPVNRFRHVMTAELTKIRTVRSMKWALLLTLVICVCLGYAVSLSLRVSFPRLPPQQRRDFDPLFATFYSFSIGQLA